jgi:hypothetical protein
MTTPQIKVPETGRNKVTQQDIDDLMSSAKFSVRTEFGKTTVMTAQLKNGFTITEAASCVAPDNYDQETGENICRQRIVRRLWELAGYELACKLYGKL